MEIPGRSRCLSFSRFSAAETKSDDDKLTNTSDRVPKKEWFTLESSVPTIFDTSSPHAHKIYDDWHAECFAKHVSKLRIAMPRKILSIKRFFAFADSLAISINFICKWDVICQGLELV